jgi:uncharacterized protein YsxB (DUF464 family)
MDVDARQAVVAALVRLGRSSHYRDRADAGRCLAGFADMASAREVLLELLLDTGDTSVTVATTAALLRRGDAVGLAIVCAGVSAAGYERLDWIHGELQSVLGVFERDRHGAMMICRRFLTDPSQDADVRTGAEQVLAGLAELPPMLLTPGTS